MRKIERKRPKRIGRRYNLPYAVSAICVALSFGAVFFAARPSQGEVRNDDQPIRIANDDDLIIVQTPARAVARGEKLSQVPLASLKWPKSRMSNEYISDFSKFQNAVALTPLPRLLPIPVSAVTTTALDNNQVSGSIPPGMRAITVRVDVESGVEGWAQSGSFVDVILVRPGRDSQSGLDTKVIAENIKILSAGRSAEPLPAEQMAPRTPSTATLLTSQEDALRIETAASLGKLKFALRGSGDSAPTTFTDTNEKRMFNDSRASAPVKRAWGNHARGPDGSYWVFEDGTGWVQSLDPHGAEKTAAAVPVPKKKSN